MSHVHVRIYRQQNVALQHHARGEQGVVPGGSLDSERVLARERIKVPYFDRAFIMMSHRKCARQHEVHKAECDPEKEDTDGGGAPPSVVLDLA